MNISMNIHHLEMVEYSALGIDKSIFRPIDHLARALYGFLHLEIDK